MTDTAAPTGPTAVSASTPVADAHRDLRDRLVAAGRLVPTGVDGIYGRDEMFESVVTGFDRLVSAAGADADPTRVEYPPMIPKVNFDRIGYLRNFPELVGPIFSFVGDAAAHRGVLDRLDAGDDYSDLLTQSELALTPACCYSVYPSVGPRIAKGGRTFETCGYCFRHEPSVDPMRLQAFRQREHIRVATPDEVLAWRDRWLERAPELLSSLGLDVVSDVANDPFFGRAGRLMKMSQREQQLKIEFLVDVYGPEHRTACSSINYHQDHFGHLFDITTADGETAHSSCIGFGFERATVAMFQRHGMDTAGWPSNVRDRLGLG
ncbi:MAG TPA: amino acid--[acyl-carrier-protein] ligase [Microthrixaceae bacterium]|nr:amino acid--[acyl-carrier-protein] ligase [Microthrixaceae bacterium]